MGRKGWKHTPETIERLRMARGGGPLRRLMAKVNKNGPNGCWLWTASTRGVGVEKYGCIWLDGRNIPSHRLSYQLHVGPVPEGKVVCHSCDVPLCVKPAHLWLGTLKDNSKDCQLKGRFTPAKLKPQDIVIIRQVLQAKGPRSAVFEGLGHIFGVQSGCIRLIAKGKTWTNVA